MSARPDLENLIDSGYEVVPNVLTAEDCDGLVQALPEAKTGTRTLLAKSIFAELAIALRSHLTLASVLKDLVVVQGIFFAKSRQSNWSLKLHRDTILPMGGIGNWPEAGFKEGQPYVQAPRSLLAQFVAVRLSLDDVPEGDIIAVPGSHIQTGNAAWTAAISIRVPQGGALLMRPNTLHGSRKLVSSETRRILHYLFAPPLLPGQYYWHYTL